MDKGFIDEKIDLFLSGRMSAEEQKAFEEELRSNLSLKEEIENRKIERQIVQRIVKEGYRNKITKWRTQAEKLGTDPDSETKSLIYRFSWLKAAAVLLLLAISIPLMWKLIIPQPSLPRLYAEYLEKPAQPIAIVRSGEPSSGGRLDSLWHLASQQFTANSYLDLEKILQEILSITTEPKEQDQAYFYLGVSHLMLDHLTEAISSLQKVGPQSQYGDQALWYMALAYLKMDNSANSLQVLEQISEWEGHYRQEKAKQLLHQLR